MRIFVASTLAFWADVLHAEADLLALAARKVVRL